MNSVREALALQRSGQLGRAREKLRGLPPPHDTDSARLSLHKAAILEQVGEHGESAALCEALRSYSLNDSERGRLAYVRGRLAIDIGRPAEALQLFQEAARLTGPQDLETFCWAQIGLLNLMSERGKPEGLASLVSQTRHSAMKSGDPQLLAAAHTFAGEMEGRYGRLELADRHATSATDLLHGSPNVWLLACAYNLRLATSILRADTGAAMELGHQALELSAEAGVASTRRACLGNMGNLYQIRGEFERSVHYLEQALLIPPDRSARNVAVLHSLAESLAQMGRTDESLQRLSELLDTSAANEEEQYAYRHAEFTRAKLLRWLHREQESFQSATRARRLAAATGDELLFAKVTLAMSEALDPKATKHLLPDCFATALRAPAPSLPVLYGAYERALAFASLHRGSAANAANHYSRAHRILKALPSILDLGDLESSFDSAALPSSPAHADKGNLAEARKAIQRCGTVLALRTRPDMLASEASLLLREYCEAATVTRAGAAPSAPVNTSPETRRVQLSPRNEDSHSLFLDVVVRDDLESIATVNAIELILNAARELEQARIDRIERAALWPADELPPSDGQAVTIGHMKELVLLARRVATTDIGVLITGESGTGKEIIARTLHEHSRRAQRPFIPFNCAAIPRDMLESQLFGHRRGAFTGADRDNPGVIRAAQGGTLFLDEIGELSPELQPKLLRFLESGEVTPIGEAIPLRADVRIVAATNTQLEAAVRERRFREDLYYRLNIVRLSLKPLRERRDEIPSLIAHFTQRALKELRKKDVRLSEETIELMTLHDWPGNVRQLQNEIRRLVATGEPGSVLGAHCLSPDIQVSTSPPALAAKPDRSETLRRALDRVEREMIKAALDDHPGQLDVAAKVLGISRKGLYLKRHRLGL